MKIGLRKPSLTKSLKARTAGRINRAAKKAVNPTYGKPGMGLLSDPKKAVYNKVYNKTSAGVGDVVHSWEEQAPADAPLTDDSQTSPSTGKKGSLVTGIILLFLGFFFLVKSGTSDILGQLGYIVLAMALLMAGAIVLAIRHYLTK